MVKLKTHGVYFLVFNNKIKKLIKISKTLTTTYKQKVLTMSLKNLFKKKTMTNTGIKNLEKIEFKGKLNYRFTRENYNRSMSDLDFLLKALDVDGEDIIIEDEELFNESVLESRRNRYHEHCNMLGIVEDKDPDSFYDLYSEWPVPGGIWSIIKFDGSERFTIQRKDKESVLELVDDLNNGRPYPYKIITNDYSRGYGIGMEVKK